MNRIRAGTAFFLAVVASGLAVDAGRAQDPALERREWTIGGIKREAFIHVPANAKEVAAPVVFAFHGHGGSMQGAARMFQVHSLWPEAISVYMQGLPTAGRLTDPEGKRRGWQRTIGSDEDRDLAFFDAVWDTLKRDWKVDSQQVYATGHSNGGGFTYLLWATRGDRFAALAPSSAVPSQEEVPLLKPKPVLHVAGEKDDLVKFSWQKLAMDKLRKLNGCRPDGEVWARYSTRYASDGGTPVITMIHPLGHAPPGDVPALIVAFFKEQGKSAESRPADSRPVESRPAESKPADSKPEDSRPAERK